ncbi:hypothetical protein VKT23_014975 [Stygiomarasmius scandens]|uniref:Uncharacterized protein n=1 Tax=Marasmiellus scandens TaxID=2682957 RepID=A0ABR1J3I4_9AGAR
MDADLTIPGNLRAILGAEGESSPLGSSNGVNGGGAKEGTKGTHATSPDDDYDFDWDSFDDSHLSPASAHAVRLFDGDIARLDSDTNSPVINSAISARARSTDSAAAAAAASSTKDVLPSAPSRSTPLPRVYSHSNSDGRLQSTPVAPNPILANDRNTSGNSVASESHSPSFSSYFTSSPQSYTPFWAQNSRKDAHGTLSQMSPNPSPIRPTPARAPGNARNPLNGLVRPPSPSASTNRSMMGQTHRANENRRRHRSPTPGPSNSNKRRRARSPSRARSRSPHHTPTHNSKGKEKESFSSDNGRPSNLRKNNSYPSSFYSPASQLLRPPTNRNETYQDSRHRVNQNVAILDNDVHRQGMQVQRIGDRVDDLSTSLLDMVNRSLEQNAVQQSAFMRYMDRQEENQLVVQQNQMTMQQSFLEAVGNLTRNFQPVGVQSGPNGAPCPLVNGATVSTPPLLPPSDPDAIQAADPPALSLAATQKESRPQSPAATNSRSHSPRPINTVIRSLLRGQPGLLGHTNNSPSLLSRLSQRHTSPAPLVTPQSLLERLQDNNSQSLVGSSTLLNRLSTNSQLGLQVEENCDLIADNDVDPMISAKTGLPRMTKDAPKYMVHLGPQPHKFPHHFRDFRALLDRWTQTIQEHWQRSQPGSQVPRYTRLRTVSTRRYLELTFRSPQAADLFVAAWSSFADQIPDAHGVLASRVSGAA